MLKVRNLHLIIILLFMTARIFAIEPGLPFIRNYPPQEYRASQQNWAIEQDRRGVMYFGNNDGLLEFDGINWRLIKLPGVRSLAIDSTGRIFAGLENDLGYLEADNAGNWQFYSLKAKIPEIHRDINTVFKVYILGEQVYFQDLNRIYIYRDEEIKVLVSNEGFQRSFVVNNCYYVQKQGRGLLTLQNDSLKFFEGSEPFATERIGVMLAYRQNEILIATRARGIYIYSPGNPDKFRKPAEFKEVDNFLIKNGAYCGTLLSGSDFAIGTFTGGILVFNAEGRIKSLFDKSAGIQDNTVLSIYSDQNRQLWAGLDNGISLIQKNLPFRKYTEQNGLYGSPICLKFFNDRFYAGTGQYLHIRDQQGNFQPIAGTLSQNFQLIEACGNLLLAHNPGIFEIKGAQATLIPNTANIVALSFSPLKKHPGNLIAGTGDGLYLLEYESSRWKLKWQIDGFDNSAYTVEEDMEGTLWISTFANLYRLKVNAALDSVVSWQHCTISQDLPGNIVVPYSLNSGEVVFGTEKGIYRYLPDKDRFEPHPDFGMITGQVAVFKQNNNGDIWFEEILGNGYYEKGILSYINGKYNQNRTPFYKFTDVSSGGISFNPDGTIFFGIPSGMVQYDPSVEVHYDRPFHSLIRAVFSKDSLLFGGTPSNLQDFMHIEGSKIFYPGRDMTFHYASTFYDDPEKTLYRYRLLGADTTWSAWVNDHKKEYTNLPEGRYTFEVRSKNQYQAIGSTASYSFTILPPWYRTWLAYIGYVLLLGSFIYGLVYFRTRKLKERSRELEKTVAQRTAQIQELSRIGRDITSSLSTGNIIHTVYENVNTLMDASVFTIGLHKPEENSLEFPATIEKNQSLPPFSVPLSDENRLGAWCFNHRQEVIINDYESEYSKYVGQLTGPIAGENPQSILYLPLWNKEKVIGVISAQSFSKNAYSEYHVNILRNLATYSAIALENADAYRRLATLLDELKSTQDKLVTQSKLAALGTLTAGIAHEIKNPLNFVNNFASLNTELMQELLKEVVKDKEVLEYREMKELKNMLAIILENSAKISEHGKRADSIVRSMLQHSRGGSGERQPADINAILEEAINLTYHGMRAQDTGFNIKIEKSLDRSIGKMEVIPQEISRAFLNIVSNGCYEAYRKKVIQDGSFSPTLSVSTQKTGNQVKISIRDNGNGIPEAIREKLFTPFFTTKPAGQGTGLGLSITWDIIVHQHNGRISFETEEGENSFSEFIILLPCTHS
jgi:signal transduction histidine kinase